MRRLIPLRLNFLYTNHCRAGFTFLELFVAMAMLSVVVIAVLQSMSSLLRTTTLVSEDITSGIQLNNAFAEPLMAQASGEKKSAQQMLHGDSLQVQVERMQSGKELTQELGISVDVVTARVASQTPGVELSRQMLMVPLPQKQEKK